MYNLYILTVLGLGGFTYGFGFSVFVTALGQPGFYTYFKLDPGSTVSLLFLDTSPEAPRLTVPASTLPTLSALSMPCSPPEQHSAVWHSPPSLTAMAGG